MIEEKTEFIRVPESLAQKIKDLTDTVEIEKEIVAYIEKSKKELHSQLDCFDEDILIFRGQLAKAKQAFKEAQETHYGETYELWENFNKTLPSTKKFIETAVATLDPLKKELNSVNELMNSISRWDLEKILELLDRIGQADPTSREMLKFLFENFKRE